MIKPSIYRAALDALGEKTSDPAEAKQIRKVVRRNTPGACAIDPANHFVRPTVNQKMAEGEMIAEVSIQIKAIHELKLLLKDDWRFLHPPNEEVQNPRTIAKQMALGMLPGAPDLIAFSPAGVREWRSHQRTGRFSALGDQGKSAA